MNLVIPIRERIINEHKARIERHVSKLGVTEAQFFAGVKRKQASRLSAKEFNKLSAMVLELEALGYK